MAPVARAILRDHKQNPITGEALLIGRQTMPFSVEQAVQMLREEGVPLRESVDLTSPDLIDKNTRHGKSKNFISDTGFFSLFTDAKFLTLDVTDYEGAEIVHDMGKPVPADLENRFNFIWNGSCLDNMFDTATAMRNTLRMLKVGGRAVLMEIGTPHHNAYAMFSPAFFFDYFAINNAADCKVYTCIFPWRAIMTTYLDMFQWKTFEGTIKQFPLHLLPSNSGLLNLVIVEKGAESTYDNNPIQGQYRPDHAPYQQAFEKFRSHKRPFLTGKKPLLACLKYWKFYIRARKNFEFAGRLDTI